MKNLLFVAALSAVSFATAQFGPQYLLSPMVNTATGVATGDLDGDGDNDLIACSQNDNTVGWFKNLGNDVFTTRKTISVTAAGARSIDAADLDNDGDLDLVVASRDGLDKIAWYRNNGDATFQPESIVTTAVNEPTCVIARDLDNDGDMDLFSTSENDNKVAFYRNTGSGVFAAQQVIPTFVAAPQSVSAGDVDNDGNIDLVVASSSDDRVMWLPHSGNLVFGSMNTVSTSLNGAFSACTADIDHDGLQDVLTASANDNKVCYFRNIGSGTFAAPVLLSQVSGSITMNARAADLDNDGWTDVISSSLAGVSIYRNVAGTLSAPQSYTTAGYSICLGNLNADGLPDIAIAGGNIGLLVEWLPNTGSAAFSTPNIISGHTYRPVSVCAADLDGDGDNDILSASRDDNKIAWYENIVPGEFAAQKIISTTAAGTYCVIAPDLDDDGLPDPVYTLTNSDQIAWKKNLGDGNFGPETIIGSNADNVRSIEAADIDGDGDPDIVSTSLQDDKVAWYANDGDGNFGSQQLISNTVDGALGLNTADIDNDGDIDVIAGASTQNQMIVFRNLGSGTFSAGTPLMTSSVDGATIRTSDLDEDGFADLTYNSISGSFWLHNNGNGTFDTGNPHPMPNGGRQVIADINQDGHLDVATSQDPFGSNDIIVWATGDGTGQFSTPQQVPGTMDQPTDLHAADLDGDGDPDLISASFFDNKTAWYRNSAIEECVDVFNFELTDTSFCQGSALQGTGSNTLAANSFSWMLDGQTVSTSSTIDYPVTTPGNHTVHFSIHHTGCATLDTIVNITVFQSYQQQPDTLLVCFGESAMIYGQQQQQTGTYTLVLTDSHGCDSTLATHLQVLPEPLPVIVGTEEICQGESALIFGVLQTSAGIYSSTIQSVNGCDSVIAIQLTVQPLPAASLSPFAEDTICIQNGLISLPQGLPAGGTFSGTGVSGSSFDPAMAGSGTHVITYSVTEGPGCTDDASQSIYIEDCLGIDENTGSGIALFPNPSEGIITITFTDAPERYSASVLNSLGETVFSQIDMEGDLQTIDLSEKSAGMYLLRIVSTGQEDILMRIVIE